MRRDWLDNALTTVIVNLSFAACVVLGLVLGFGLFKDVQPAVDAQNVTRLLAAALAAFAAPMAFSLFLLRRNIAVRAEAERQMSTDLVRLLDHVNPDLDQIFLIRDQLDPFAETLQRHRTLWMAGMGLRTITTDHLPIIRRFLEDGKSARFILVAPHSPACDVIAASFFEGKTSERYSNDVEDSLHAMSSLLSAHPQQLEVRVLNYVPATAITVLDVGLEDEEVVLELYTYATSTSRPHIRLNPNSSPQWYRYFVSEFDTMWRRATSWYRP